MPKLWSDRALRVFRYAGSLFTGAIGRLVLELVYKRAPNRRGSIGKWTFFGPDELVSLVAEAQAQLQATDPELLRALAQLEYKVFFDKKTFNNFSFWGFGIVSQAYVAWGAEGLVTAIVYFWFNAQSFCEAGRWACSIPSHSRAVDRRARDETRAWLTRHGFAPELRIAFEANGRDNPGQYAVGLPAPDRQ